MYSSRSGQTDHRRHYSDSGSRHQGKYQDKREERRQFHSAIHSDSHHKHDRNGHSSRQTETHSKRSKEYNNSPKRRHGNDGTSRKSPEGRRSLSPDWFADGNKKRRLESDDDRHRYRREPEDKMYRRSQQNLYQQNFPKYLKCTETQKVKQSTDSHQSHRHVEFAFKQEHVDYRPLSAGQLNREYRKPAEQMTQTMKHSTTSSGKPIARDESPSRSTDDDHHHHHVRTRFSLNEPDEESFKPHKNRLSPTAPEEKSNRGFQRFLDLLNKGVNVDMLTKIVTLNPQNADGCQQSTVFLTDSAHCPRSPHSLEEQHADLQNNYHRREGEGSQLVSSPQLHQKSYSSNEEHQSEERFLQVSDKGETNNGIQSRPRSPSVIKEKAMIPEDEQKHRQLQDVLKAIGLDLGSEELGQMSNRIQERLYGKKDQDQGGCRRESKEGCSKQDVSLTNLRRSSSSSNGSTYSTRTGDSCLTNDSCSTQRHGTMMQQIQVIQRVIHSEYSTRTSVQDCKEVESNSQESAATTMGTFSTTNRENAAEPPFTLPLGMYRPLDSSQQLYLALPSLLPSAPSPSFPPPTTLLTPLSGPTSFPTPIPAPQLARPVVGRKALLPTPSLAMLPKPPPAFLPFLPPVLPQFLPHSTSTVIFPPNLSNTLPPASTSPAVFPATNHPPEHINQPHFLNMLNTSTPNLNNTAQKSKTRPRARCLQVIKTKQSG